MVGYLILNLKNVLLKSLISVQFLLKKEELY